jgi:tetratricopeptide (TPR) repeat protein
LASQGEYAEAALNHERALVLANRLGNESVALGITGNLLLCYCRLGQYEAAMNCATAGFEALGAETLGLTELQLAYGAGISSAMRGRPNEALEAIDRIDRRPIAVSAHWMRQAWLLWKADVLYLCKRRGDALHAAREATALSEDQPLSMSFIGPFSRWRGVIAETDGEGLDCLAVLERHLENLSHYDAIDQLELLASTVHILRLANRDSAALSAKLHARLLTLPNAIAFQMRELGVLPTP